MPLCNKKKQEEVVQKAPRTAQKIVIPKGMINPNETTIIEIPARLHDQPLVIAKRKINSPTFTSETYNRTPNSNMYEKDPSYYADDSNKSKPMVVQKPKPVQKPPESYSAFMPDYNSSYRDDCQQRASQGYSTCAPKKEYPNQPFETSSAYATAGSKDLDVTEMEEKMTLEKTLLEFQAARRKLLNNASQLANTSNLENFNPKY